MECRPCQGVLRPLITVPAEIANWTRRKAVTNEAFRRAGSDQDSQGGEMRAHRLPGRVRTGPFSVCRMEHL